MTTLYSVAIALAFNGLDLLTGIIYAIKSKSIKSSKLRDGLFKKVGFILCYFIAWLVDTYGYMIGFNVAKILPIIILYVCTTELVSILENICKINPDILPDKLMDMFNIHKE